MSRTRSSHRGWFALVLALVGTAAGVLAFRRRVQPAEDPWARAVHTPPVMPAPVKAEEAEAEESEPATADPAASAAGSGEPAAD